MLCWFGLFEHCKIQKRPPPAAILCGFSLSSWGDVAFEKPPADVTPKKRR